MTVQEFYDWALKNGYCDYEIVLEHENESPYAMILGESNLIWKYLTDEEICVEEENEIINLVL